jgi:hypothetical protein
MVKLYESAFTYLPFLYLFAMTTAVAEFYHSENEYLVRHRPYTVLVFMLINTFAYKFFKNSTIIKSATHGHTWKCVILATYGILVNLVHEMVFHYNHFDEKVLHNHLGSAFYILCVLISGYVYMNEDALRLVNILFLFVPINRTWETNLHMYAVYVALSIYLLFRVHPHKSQIDPSVEKMPLLRYFCYLRVQDSFIACGVLQLLFENYANTQRYIVRPCVEEIDNAILEAGRLEAETDE